MPMTFDSCSRYCQRYNECWPIIWALKSYERLHEEKHPIERLFFSEWSVPHCHKPHPPKAG